MAEYDKSTLLELSKQAPNNRCMDCNSPHPQWASVNHGVFICLECSGEHRSLGVHISFVRSLTMDKWTPEQIRKMQEGGNAKATAFFQASPEYSSSMSITQKYNTHFAAQYREKLLCDVEGREFIPSAAPPPSESTSSLRKPRSGGAGSGISGRSSPNPPISRSSTPVTNASSVGGQSNPYATEQTSAAATSQKTANENYFATLGAANAGRSADLPPSQGGKYTGFGSSPMPSPGNSAAGGSSSGFHPSSITSSKALPTLNDLQNDPLKALGKGWGLFSSTVSLATKQINEAVIQPGLAKVQDPNLQSSLSGYYTKGGEFISYGLQTGQAVLGEGLKQGNDWAKSRGLDTGLLDKFGNVIQGGHSAGGYEQNGGAMGYSSLSHNGQIPQPASLDAQEAGFADFNDFNDFAGKADRDATMPPPSRAKTVNQTYPSYGSTSNTGSKKPQDDEEEDFFNAHLKATSPTASVNSGRSTPAQSVEDGLKNMSIGNGSGSGIKRPLGRKGLGAVRSATPPAAAAKKKDDDDEWAKFD
ncbi:ArfGap-domain-containing protein [Cystobasidium minutum MCA 4210]|uniref:ArfGap-domain-containing protein n=1 Tax=Cystobasidium minutum MCA 4210 TaxID=1397322 RepID=UPI0034CE4940|eukprot:jgi/Rhomi1/187082/estExt_fgenesh1_pg.C_1_t10348